jgi:phosphate transport system protein
MRAAFIAQLSDLERRITDELERAANALARVNAAVDDPAAQRIAAVAAEGEWLRGKAAEAHAELVIITACQAPVAGDLRLVLAMIELAQHTRLIANQFLLISEQLTSIDPSTVDRYNVRQKLARMGSLAKSQLRKATAAFRTRDLATARSLEADDDELDDLNREIAGTAARSGATREHRERMLRNVLIARSLERIGDNAVDIGELAAFLLTAERQEFSDASHPRGTRRA